MGGAASSEGLRCTETLSQVLLSVKEHFASIDGPAFRFHEKSMYETTEDFMCRAKSGEHVAEYKYGLCLWRGRGVKEDKAQAIEYFKRSCVEGDSDGMMLCGLGMLYMCLEKTCKRAEILEAVQYLKKSADGNNEWGEMWYGTCVLCGLGKTDPNVVRPVEYVSALMENEGEQWNADEEVVAAVKYIVRASKHMNARGKFWYGMCFLMGYGVKHSSASAASLFKQGLHIGDPFACYMYGFCLKKGYGVPRDRIAAARYFKWADNMGEMKYAHMAYRGLLRSLKFSEDVLGLLMGHTEERSKNVSDWILKSAEWTSVDDINGRGETESEVAKNVYTGELAIVKTLTSADVQGFLKEVGVLIAVNCPCVISFRGITLPIAELNTDACTFTEYVKGCTLETLLWGKDGMTIAPIGHTEITIIIIGMAFGMRHIHSLDILHRNLTPANVIVDDNCFPRIMGFNLGCFADDLTTTVVDSSPVYMAPELYADDDGYTKKVDVFSFGMILYELIYRKRCFSGRLSQIMNDNTAGIRPDLVIKPGDPGYGVSVEIPGIIAVCWSVIPEVRLDFSQIIEILGAIEFKLFDDADQEKVLMFVRAMCYPCA